MRLDEGLEDQKLSLDITPLIDIIFLLVLFFAVSTSFISGEDLRTLQTNVVEYDEERKTLQVEVEQKSSAIAELETDFTRMVERKTREIQQLAQKLETTDGKAAKLEFMVAALENQKVELETDISSRAEKNKTLEGQLEKAYSDFQNLNAELASVRSESDRRAEEERLLRALLLERDAEKTALDAERGNLKQQLASLQTTVSEREDALKSQQSEAEAAAARETLLQKLLAEKAAELDGKEVLIADSKAAALALQEQLNTVTAQSAAATIDFEKQNQTLKTQTLRLQAELNKYREVADLDREQIERILRAQEQLEQGLGSYMEEQQVGIKRDQQRLTLQLSDKILFASGSANIKREGLDVLKKLGDILAERADSLEIQIGGHTDNIPIRGRSGPLADNWGLSAARAVTVARFFEKQVGIKSERMSAVGYSEFRPVADNSTREGRSQNRRIEIVLLPR